MSRRKTRSTEEALGVLENSRHQYKIEIARDIARRIALRDGRVNSRQVRQVLFEQGLLDPNERELWIGAIFQPSLWEATGDPDFKYSDRERNIHSRKVTWWRLRTVPLPTRRSRKKGASGSDVAPTSSDKRTRPPEEPEAPAVPRSKAEALPCMQLDLLGAAR